MRRNSKKLTAIGLTLLGLSLLTPILLTAVIVVALNTQLQSSQPPSVASQSAPQEYATSFQLIVRQGDQNIHIWVRNLDSVPDYRQVTVESGEIVSQQLYLGVEKTLYSSQQKSDLVPEWTKTENIEPSDIGISNIMTGPAVWALQYGVGDHQIPLQQGSLSVSVIRVNEPIDTMVFDTTGSIDLNENI